jgi:hypothetical protein
MMRNIFLRITVTLLCVYCATVAYAQQSQPVAAVPKLVRFSGSFRPADNTPARTMESATLSVYRDQTGGAALWHEIQNVAVDVDGRYSVLMGATQNEGMPLDLFTSGEPRWLGVQFNRPGEAEQPRVLLVSVPYALKASDSDTLGGKPASAYLLAAPAVGTATGSAASVTTTTSTTTASVKPRVAPVNSGMPNYIGKFTNTTDLIDSSMYETGGNVGISTTAPLISLDVRTGSLPQMGIAGTTDYLTFFASDSFGPAIYWDPAKDMRFGKGGASLYNPFGFVEYMRIKSSNGNMGIGTQAPAAKLDVVGDIRGLNTSTDSTHPTLHLQNNDSTSAGDLVFQAIGPNFGGNCTIDVSGNLFCTGTLAHVTRTAANRQVAMYTVQASESLVEDVGSGALSHGVAVVEVAPDFAQTIPADGSYRVFLTPNGDCEGVYVTNKTATSFEVHELRNGKSNVQFDYRIVAHRKGFEAARLPDVTEKMPGNVVKTP